MAAGVIAAPADMPPRNPAPSVFPLVKEAPMGFFDKREGPAS